MYLPKAFTYEGDAKLTSNHACIWGRAKSNTSDATTNMRGPDFTPHEFKITGGAMNRASRFGDNLKFL